MSLRKFMHPRNKYREAPDFKQLAVLYPEFCSVATTDLSGRVHIDFKDENCLRVLTQVLLKHDFNLEVKIPPNKLVPTLPLRLNYVLWIEDLMKHANFCDMRLVSGIDIGTGAVCIYPLLLAKMYECHMIGIDVDETSVQTAIQNVRNNSLQDLIKVTNANEETVLKSIVERNGSYHFVMCNPPFFDTGADSDKPIKQLPPRNAPTGNIGELSVEGGERTFVMKMIEESIELGDKVKIYTTMLGQKKNLVYLIKYMKKKQIENLTWTEFCQGYTKRWGLGWTFAPKDIINLTKAPVIRKSGDYISRLLKDQPVEITFPARDHFSTVDDFKTLFKSWAVELKLEVKELSIDDDEFDGWACKLIAVSDCWTHARRKRRQAQRQKAQSECQEGSATAKNGSPAINIVPQMSKEANTESTPVESKTYELKEEHREPLLVCNIFIQMGQDDNACEESTFKICMAFERGTGGKTALETFRQYLINKLNIREYIQKRQSETNRKKRKRLKSAKTDLGHSSLEASDQSHIGDSGEETSEHA